MTTEAKTQIPTLANLTQIIGGTIAHVEICHSPCPKGREDKKEPTPILQIKELGQTFPLKGWIPDSNGRLRWKIVDLVALMEKISILRAEESKKAESKKDAPMPTQKTPKAKKDRGEWKGKGRPPKALEESQRAVENRIKGIISSYAGTRPETMKIIGLTPKGDRKILRACAPLTTTHVLVRVNWWGKIRASAHSAFEAATLAMDSRPAKDWSAKIFPVPPLLNLDA